MKYLVTIALLLSSLVSIAQYRIPAGTILPAQLSSTIDSRKAHPGDRISARLKQEVNVPGSKLPQGARLSGKVLSVDPSRVTITFDKVEADGHAIPIRTNLRAIAGMTAVLDAQMPSNTVSGDRGSALADWNTIQVGDQVAYGRNGPLMAGSRVVGHSLMSGGVVGVPETSYGSKCRGDVGDSKTPQSLWVFATSACGVYGIDGLTLDHAGRTEPVGQIAFSSSNHVLIRAGSGVLLRVVD